MPPMPSDTANAPFQIVEPPTAGVDTDPTSADPAPTAAVHPAPPGDPASSSVDIGSLESDLDLVDSALTTLDAGDLDGAEEIVAQLTDAEMVIDLTDDADEAAIEPVAVPPSIA